MNRPPKHTWETCLLYTSIDSFLEDAIEVDVDAVRDASGDVFIAGIMEHVEEAGVHSGDSACALPPQSLSAHVLEVLAEYTTKIADALTVVGLIKMCIRDSSRSPTPRAS